MSAKHRRRMHMQLQDVAQPLSAHVQELRHRLFYIAVSVAAFSAVAYGFEQQIVRALLRPAHDQQFIYTSVGGGIDFLFRVCVYAGIAASIPVIIAQVLRYVQPLMSRGTTKFIAIASAVSGLFAVAGMMYGYFWGLPAALHFLLHQFVTQQIRPLVTIQSYMSFVTVYMLGSALLFQVPLVMIYINRIKPLKPRGLLKYERWVIGLAFVCSGLMNPSPNILAQLLLAGPIILMYQAGIIIVWLTNRRGHRSHVVRQLLQQDAELQATRMQQFAVRQTVVVQTQRQAGMQRPANRQPAQVIVRRPLATTGFRTQLSVSQSIE